MHVNTNTAHAHTRVHTNTHLASYTHTHCGGGFVCECGLWWVITSVSISHTHTHTRETHGRQASDVTVVIETALSQSTCDWLGAVWRRETSFTLFLLHYSVYLHLFLHLDVASHTSCKSYCPTDAAHRKIIFTLVLQHNTHKHPSAAQIERWHLQRCRQLHGWSFFFFLRLQMLQDKKCNTSYKYLKLQKMSLSYTVLNHI